MFSKGLIALIYNELGQLMVKNIVDAPQVVAVVVVVVVVIAVVIIVVIIVVVIVDFNCQHCCYSQYDRFCLFPFF